MISSVSTFSTFYVGMSGMQTFSVRACARTRTCAGVAIFVQMGAEKFSEMCIRVHEKKIPDSQLVCLINNRV